MTANWNFSSGDALQRHLPHEDIAVSTYGRRPVPANARPVIVEDDCAYQPDGIDTHGGIWSKRGTRGGSPWHKGNGQ